MRHKNLFRAAFLGMAMTVAGIPAAAAGMPDVSELANQLAKRGVVVYGRQTSAEELKNTMEAFGIDCSGWDLSELERYLANCKPETGLPKEPETNGPETELPDAPETNAPETELPKEPETNVPETELPKEPETNVPETELPKEPETNVPETELPDAPETNAPETEFPKEPETNSPALSYEQQVISLVNVERAKEGLAPLEYDAQVAQAALVRAKETEISFSHTRPNGAHFTTALTESGVSYRGAGENIAWGQRTPEEVMEGWMNSPGHRANIMNPQFRRIGVGYYQNGSGTNYWTQLFTY